MSKPSYALRGAGRRRGGGPAALLLALLSLGLLILPQQGQAKIDFSLCDVCGRIWDESPARMRCTVDLGHNHSRTLIACSPFCMLERMEDYEDKPRGQTQIVLHKEYKQSTAIMLIAERSWYLVDIDGDPDKDNEPHVAAFRNKKAAEAAQAELGGRVRDWEALAEQVRKLTDEWEPRAPRDFPPLRPGRKTE